MDTLQLILCYSYGDYANLQNLCDQSQPHAVINSLGVCFTEFEVSLDSAQVIAIEKHDFVQRLSDDEKEIFDLASFIQLQSDPTHDCGTLGFKLTDEEQSLLVDLTEAGELSFKKVTDPVLIGEHVIHFDMFLSDFDPSGIYSQTADFKLMVKIVADEESFVPLENTAPQIESLQG